MHKNSLASLTVCHSKRHQKNFPLIASSCPKFSASELVTMDGELKAEIAEVFRMFDEEDCGSINVTELTSALFTVTGEQMSREEALALMNRYDKDRSGEIDLSEFETLVMERLKGRGVQEETSRAFKLLEDKDVPGFVTRESLRKAALSIGEKIPEAELLEMFDQLVTGQSTPAVDFATFCSIQYAAEQEAAAVSSSGSGSLPPIGAR